MSLVQEIKALCDTFQQQARDAFQASGGKLEAYNSHIAKATDELMAGLLKKFESLHTQMEQQTNEVKDLKLTIGCQAAAIERLEKKVKAIETRDKRNQKFQVKNNLIIRSSQKPKEIGKFLCDTIQAGSADGMKPANNVFTLTEIIPRDKGNPQDDSTSQAENTQPEGRSRAIYRAVFKDFVHVKSLWKGIPTTNKAGSSTQISSEMPRYLKSLYSDFERAAYTMRTTFNKEGIKTRIVTKNLSLKMQFRTSDHKDWLDASSPIIEDKLDTPLMFKDGERIPNIHPTVRDILKRADKHF